MRCPAKWYFRYLIGLSEPTTALGRAFHATLARNFGQKMRDDEDVDELAATGKILAATYLAEAAGPLLPHAVEQTVQGEIAGVKVRGIVDLLDIDGRVQNPNMVNVIASEHRITEYQTAGLVNAIKQQTDKLQ